MFYYIIPGESTKNPSLHEPETQPVDNKLENDGFSRTITAHWHFPGQQEGACKRQPCDSFNLTPLAIFSRMVPFLKICGLVPLQERPLLNSENAKKNRALSIASLAFRFTDSPDSVGGLNLHSGERELSWAKVTWCWSWLPVVPQVPCSSVLAETR